MKKFLLALVVLLCCVSASRAKVESPEVPLSDSTYADLELFNSSAESACEDCQFEITRAMTRYEFAIVVARLLQRVDAIGEDGKVKETTRHSSDWPDLSKTENKDALKRLTEKFRPELETFGVNVRILRINGELLIDPKTEPPFADVPKNHWASEAVEKLRLSGIVIGVSDGS